MTFKLKYKNLKGVIEQLKGASKKHKKQAEILEKHVDKMKSPLEQEDDLGYTGVNFDPSAGYTTTGKKIPGFRDMVSLEQQKAIAKKTDERRARRRKSYCSRSLGQMKMHNISCSKTPEKRICAARRRWRC